MRALRLYQNAAAPKYICTSIRRCIGRFDAAADGRLRAMRRPERALCDVVKQAWVNFACVRLRAFRLTWRRVDRQVASTCPTKRISTRKGFRRQVTKARPSQPSDIIRVPIAGLLAWLLPGLGHLFIGQRTRGLIFLITIGVTFWGGVAIGSVQGTVDHQQRRAWFMAQVCAGSHCFLADWWGGAVRRDAETKWEKRVPVSERQLMAREVNWSSSETGVVYTGMAGLLNLLVIVDVLVRADARAFGRAGAAAEKVEAKGP